MRRDGIRQLAAAGAALLIAVAPVAAQDATERGLQKFRDMLAADPWANPALLDADRGEALWKARKGPRKRSLEACDLGQGPGKLDGAFAQLPRYFSDAGRVMDLETRIAWCMEKLQGFDVAAYRRDPYPASGAPVKDIGAIATFVVTRSAGRPLAPPTRHPREKAAIALGESLFYRRTGPFDFACASCHSGTGKRIRLQPLAQLATPEGASKVVGTWPAYRVSTTNVMTMQHRLMDCFWQMRLHKLDFGSEASIALAAFLADKARGGQIAAPGIKR